MFPKSTEQRATIAALHAVRPLVGLVQHDSGLPLGFWNDPYVLGFLSRFIDFHAKLATAGRLSHGAAGDVLARVFGQLSNLNGDDLSRQSAHLRSVKHVDFAKGTTHAATIVYFAIKLLREEAKNPLVQAAIMIVGNEDDRPAIIGAMLAESLLAHLDSSHAQRSGLLH